MSQETAPADTGEPTPVVPAQRQPDVRVRAGSRLRPWMILVVILLFLGQMAAGMVTAARQQSPTVDEPVYIGTAATYLQDHRFTYNYEHPPLAKLVIASGLAFTDVKLLKPYSNHPSALGTSLLYEDGNDAQHVLFAARLPMIILTLLFGLVVFAFARDLTGPIGGLLALALYAFSPDAIAFGALANVDLPSAGFLLTALWLLWRARQRPYVYLPLAGVALGASTASKMSTLPAVPIVGLLVVLTVWHLTRDRVAGERPVLRRLGLGAAAAAGVVAISVAVVWVCYLVVDPQMHWVSPTSVGPLTGVKANLTNLLPYPRAYRDGMRYQFNLEHATYSGFLFGESYQGSKWYYIPAALLIKEPIGMLILWIMGTVAMLITPRLRAAAPYILVPTLLLTLVALAGSRNWGVRYAIFVPVILAVVAAAVMAYRQRWLHVAAGLLAAYVAVSSLSAFPYYLAYSNEAFGGVNGTHEVLTDSNVDWGQDLSRLGTRLKERYPGQPVFLMYKGRGEPAYYGITAISPFSVPLDQVHGVIAISERCLAPMGACLPTTGNRRAARAQLDQILATSRKDELVGGSIQIYLR
ncbi:ArnT family glycosyltransferase [Actinoplanes sp. NPDC020271]|uniref:ArnT family glycosyltransferase n=1 Tax=Actinoplanes sp. NPDC020271 TaxID=3363896 RepID=UPI0037AA5A83